MSKNKVKSYSSYKNSGEDWIGDVPDHWEISRLASILTTVSTKNRTDLPLLSITREKGVIIRDIENDEENHNYIPDDLSNYKFLPKGYFGMNKMKAWQGSYGISEQDGIVSPAYFIFKLREDLNERFFHLAIRSKLYIEYFGSASDGVRVGQWDLSKPRMKNIPFLIPPPKEQTAIAEFLDKKTALIDQAISIKEKQIELLKERQQILIQNAVTQGLNLKVKRKDSGVGWIGEIPEHWEVKKVKHFGRIKSGESVVNSLLNENGLYEVFGGNGSMGYYNDFNVDGKNIIIGRVGALCGNVRLISEKKWISDNALILRLSKEEYYEYLSLVLVVGDLNKLNSSNAQPLITGSKVLNFSVPIPNKKERDEIIHYVNLVEDKILKATDFIIKEIEKLKEYRSTIINSAVTGKIKVC